jgi:hypothetical protein
MSVTGLLNFISWKQTTFIFPISQNKNFHISPFTIEKWWKTNFIELRINPYVYILSNNHPVIIVSGNILNVNKLFFKNIQELNSHLHIL